MTQQFYDYLIYSISSGYYRTSVYWNCSSWFDIGDVAKIDKFGFMTITDRTKGIIKSGGEWISSIDLENICVVSD